MTRIRLGYPAICHNEVPQRSILCAPPGIPPLVERYPCERQDSTAGLYQRRRTTDGAHPRPCRISAFPGRDSFFQLLRLQSCCLLGCVSPLIHARSEKLEAVDAAGTGDLMVVTELWEDRLDLA